MVLGLLLACADGGASVRVAIVDSDGAPFAGANVEYRVDRGAYVPADCATGAEPDACSAYVAGRGVLGEIQVVATWEGEQTSACCWQHAFDSQTVEVVAGAFGAPVTQRISLVIDEDAELCGDCGYGY